MNWQKIVIHHTASPTEVRRSGKTVPVDTALIREWHIAQGWSDIGYNFVIMPDGSCQDGRPLTRSGAHCKASSRNSIGIGICLVGNFSKNKVPENQLNGLVTKVVQVMKDHKLNIEAVELHRDVTGAATECPGLFFSADILREKIKRLSP